MNSMTDWTNFQLIEALWKAISTEFATRNSPLRTPTVATAGSKHPHIRTMVLREMHPYHLIFFTDRRSQKCIDITVNPNASVHCYLSSSKQQIQLYGTMSMSMSIPMSISASSPMMEPSPNTKRLMANALRRPQDYSTFDPPGFEVATLDAIHYDQSLAGHNFVPLVFTVTEIHLLTLGSPHQRCKWQRDLDNNLWSKHWLVP